MANQIKHISKLMSLVLRHKPEEIGLQLDEQGWANVDELISGINSKGIVVNLSIINEVVETNDKKRFAFNEDKTLIRASQGHSIEVDLALEETEPPAILYHGTAVKYVDSILQSGLRKQNRQHLHLSATVETARAVGSRHGSPVILVIDAKQMYGDGFKFYLSANKVWLTETVPVQYITQ
jgi:putative RNA 2'-phosphotransferase